LWIIWKAKRQARQKAIASGGSCKASEVVEAYRPRTK
jgi:hypothetical protein